MWTFILGLLLGFAAKAVYDLFREEQFPIDMGLNSGRIEAMLDETRQSLRELREEVRKVATSEGSVQEKASRVVSAASEAVKSSKAAVASGTREEKPTVTGGSADSDTGADSGSDSRSSSSGQGAPSTTRGSRETMT